MCKAKPESRIVCVRPVVNLGCVCVCKAHLILELLVKPTLNLGMCVIVCEAHLESSVSSRILDCGHETQSVS